MTEHMAADSVQVWLVVAHNPEGQRGLLAAARSTQRRRLAQT